MSQRPLDSGVAPEDLYAEDEASYLHAAMPQVTSGELAVPSAPPQPPPRAAAQPTLPRGRRRAKAAFALAADIGHGFAASRRRPLTTEQQREAVLRNEARKRVAARTLLGTHLVVYVGVIAMLWVIWAITTTGGFPWPLPATMGWGVGVAAHAHTTWRFVHRRFNISREIDRLERQALER